MMFLLPILAAAAAPALDCENAFAQQEMNRCAAIEFEQADKELNRQWKITAAVMKKRDADYGDAFNDGRPGYFQTLLDSQRAWLQYRDRQCANEGYLFRGGTMEPLMVGTCKTRLTKLRSEELHELESAE
jgi:uncharacterized protein YecT (DUF1311 family)